MDILLTNDDGIFAHGIRALAKALTDRGHSIHVVAPMQQQSGVSQCLTIFSPLRIAEIKEENFSGTGVYGTPADCVKVALGGLLAKQPDMIISGINLGANVGCDLLYSGTVAAAVEACQTGLPSIALSYASHEATDVLLEARHMVALIEAIDWQQIPPRRVININYPALPREAIKGVKICSQSMAVWENVYRKEKDPRGVPYFWLIGDMEENDILPDSDRALLAEGYITISALQFDYTDQASLKALSAMPFANALSSVS